MNKINIKFNDPEFIQAKDCVDLRSRILRPGLDVKYSIYAEDDFESTFHLGISRDNKIICNGTFMKNICPHFLTETSAYRLRGMATDLNFQNQGLGRTILQKAEILLKEKNCKMLWFNARASAFDFYLKCGYEIIGEMFDIPQVGPHKVMFKKL